MNSLTLQGCGCGGEHGQLPLADRGIRAVTQGESYMDAFISHASKDTPMAVQIEEALEDDGLQVWLDHSEIRLGALLRRELQTAIKNSHILILLWSKAAAKSRWVAAEVLTAFHLDRFIVACVYDNTPLPYFFRIRST